MADEKRARHIAAVISLLVLVTLGAAACATATPSQGEQGEPAQLVDRKAGPWPGMDVVADAKGVRVTKVLRHSAAALLGLQQGDFITSMNDTPVRDMTEYNRVLQEVCGEGFWAAYTRKDRNFETVWIDRVR
jgi:membrane-associated protease RseP (regulator of RpoE activity)